MQQYRSRNSGNGVADYRIGLARQAEDANSARNYPISPFAKGMLIAATVAGVAYLGLRIFGGRRK